MKTRESAPKGASQISAPQRDRDQSTAPVRLSRSLRRLLISQFTASDLRHLAALMEAESPGMVARQSLSDASIDELAEMLTDGRKPTIGFWRRHSEVAA
jgi:hypothetical protein